MKIDGILASLGRIRQTAIADWGDEVAKQKMGQEADKHQVIY